MNNNKKAYSKMLMIWIIGLIVLAIFLIWRFWVQDWLAHRKAAETQNKLPAGIEVIEQGDKKIVRNTVEGYEVTVPKGWDVPESPLVDEKIIVQWIGSDQKLETEMQDGVYMQLYTFDNPQNLSIQEWAVRQWEYKSSEINIININNISILRRIKKVQFGQDDEDPIIIEDSQVVRLSFNLDHKIYTYTCTSRGANYLAYSKECENLAIENIKKLSQ